MSLFQVSKTHRDCLDFYFFVSVYKFLINICSFLTVQRSIRKITLMEYVVFFTASCDCGCCPMYISLSEKAQPWPWKKTLWHNTLNLWSGFSSIVSISVIFTSFTTKKIKEAIVSVSVDSWPEKCPCGKTCESDSLLFFVEEQTWAWWRSWAIRQPRVVPMVTLVTLTICWVNLKLQSMHMKRLVADHLKKSFQFLLQVNFFISVFLLAKKKQILLILDAFKNIYIDVLFNSSYVLRNCICCLW